MGHDDYDPQLSKDQNLNPHFLYLTARDPNETTLSAVLTEAVINKVEKLKLGKERDVSVRLCSVFCVKTAFPDLSSALDWEGGIENLKLWGRVSLQVLLVTCRCDAFNQSVS